MNQGGDITSGSNDMVTEINEILEDHALSQRLVP